MWKRRVLVFVLLVLFVLSAEAISASFQGLGFLPGSFHESEARGISGDGSTIVGLGHGYGFYWTKETGMVSLGFTRANSASYDGSVIVGETRDWNAFRWTQDTGIVRIYNSYSIASDVSDDGSVIVGEKGGGVFYWTESMGIQILGCRGATAVSSDGSVVIGQGGREAFRWTAESGMVGLGVLPNSAESCAYGISNDGSTIVGRCWRGRDEAFIWTESDGMIGLGDLPGGSSSSWARDVSADGSVVVGCSKTDLGWETFIWDKDNGMQNLKDVLENDYNLDLTGWTLTWPGGISADGTVIAGRGYNPNGEREAWIATIPEPCSVLLLGVGGLVVMRLRRRKNVGG